MADVSFNSDVIGYKEKLIDIGDGTHAQRRVMIGSDGQPVATYTSGRKAASGSQPVALSNEDKASLDAAKANYSVNGGAYVIGTARTAGTGILAVVTTAGSAIFTFGGVDITFPLAVGPTILPLAVTKVAYPGSGAAAGAFYAIS